MGEDHSTCTTSPPSSGANARYRPVRFIYYAFLFLAVLSPTGAFYGVDLKPIIFLLMIVIAGTELLRLPVLALTALVGILVLYAVASGNEIAWVQQHTLAMLMWLFSGILGVVSCSRGASPTGFILCAVTAIVIYAILKAVVLSLYFFGLLDFWTLILGLQEITGHRFPAWEGADFRITASNENLVIFFPFFLKYLINRKLVGPLTVATIVIASVFILVTSNSRLLYFGAAIYVLVFFRSIYFQLLILPPGILALGVQLWDRFQNLNASLSDEIRWTLVAPLLDGLSSSPVLGKGLGWYSSEIVRFDYRPWLYELQVLSTTAQLGILGFSVLIGSVLAIMYRIRVPAASYMIFGTLTFMAIFNSFLFTISSSAAMMLAFSLANRRI